MMYGKRANVTVHLFLLAFDTAGCSATDLPKMPQALGLGESVCSYLLHSYIALHMCL